jgi:LAO/AO transport system kinase
VSARRPSPAELAEGVRRGDVRALARAISLLEDGDPDARELLRSLQGDGARAHAVGVTGPPGVGKSTLISALVSEARARGLSVGVVAVDPTSPFSDGALLGDRIRLAEHFLDPDVFIRSMGSRGRAGGLAGSTLQTLLLLGAAGKDVVFLETVGAGQGEVGVLAIADTVVLVLMPGAGDSVQALKAGIMEIPDLVALNKRDLPGVERAARELRQVLSLGPGTPPALVMTDALAGAGTGELWTRIERHRAEGEADGSLAARRGRNAVAEVMAVASARARRYLENAVAADPELEALLAEVALGRLDPLSGVEEILRTVFRIGDEDNPHTR